MMARFVNRWGPGRGREDGQALVLFAAALVVVLIFVGLSVDVGRVLWARTQMQAAVDAAALAGAQDMSNGQPSAQAFATTYWDANNDFIEAQGNNVQMNVSFPPGNRAIQVEASAEIPTWFLRLGGLSNWNVNAKGTASAQVLDMGLVLDISGSMCWTSYPIVESGGSVQISPGRNGPAGGAFPRLVNAVAAGGPNTITIKLNDIRIFNSVSAANNRTNFGNAFNSPQEYWRRSPGGGARTGIIRIDQELFRITGVNAASNELTVERSQANNRLGLPTPKQAHSPSAEVWANRGAGANGSADVCDAISRVKATTSQNGPHEPFDTEIDDAKLFINMFNGAYDKIGIASYSTTAQVNHDLTGSFTTLENELDQILYPNGRTNAAHGLAKGLEIVNGPGKRLQSYRVIVLVTDGIPNTRCSNGYNSANCNTATDADPPGCPYAPTQSISDAIARAADARSQGIIVHTIGLGADVKDCVLQDIAAAGGGNYYKAPTAAQLDDAFRAIAEQTHIALTD